MRASFAPTPAQLAQVFENKWFISFTHEYGAICAAYRLRAWWRVRANTLEKSVRSGQTPGHDDAWQP
jgi:hypothetical protein